MALSREDFVRHLASSGLMDADEVASFLSSFPADQQPSDGEQLARELVKQKKLTKFQAEQISSGKGTTLVLGNYTILDKLGQGGMGVVLKAEHKRMKRLVALKVMSPSAVKTPDALKRFHREVEAAAKLRHPNIVAADDADEAKGTHFLVMEYVEGSDLSALVKKQGPLPVDQAVGCILQAARGLEFAHKRGVIHRDIKPANLLLDREGTVKILDMGLARIEGEVGAQAELTSTGAVMGTVDYMAPEQALSTKHADARSDIYSLGISLWYLLTGMPTYEGDSLMARLMAHANQPIPSLTDVRADVPESVDAVFQKMVAKQPKDRYQSMTEVIADLEGILGGTGSSSSLRIQINLSGSLSSGIQESSSKASRSSRSPATDSVPQPKATYTPSADSATEATMLPGDLAQATETQTLPSSRSPLVGKKNGTGSHKGRKSAAVSVWWKDRRVQIGGGIGALLLLMAVVFLWPGKKRVPNKTSEIAKNDSAATSVGRNENISPASARNEATNSSTKAPPPAIAPFDETQARKHQEEWANHLGVPVEYTNSLGMTFMLIPPGEFIMGSGKEELARYLEEAKAANDTWVVDHVSEEGPQHRVRITQPFYLGKYELTQAQWQAVMGGNPSAFQDNLAHPVENVSWEDTQKLLDKLNVIDAETKFALPTEAQWEYACRAGTDSPWSFGDTETTVAEYGWIMANSDGTTHPVGQKRSNGFGLFDMHGNVWEWCADWYGADSYALTPVDDPHGNPSGVSRVNRGGCWGHHARVCRSAYRGQSSPNDHNHFVGFRVALTIDLEKAKAAQARTVDRDASAADYALRVDGNDRVIPPSFEFDNREWFHQSSRDRAR